MREEDPFESQFGKKDAQNTSATIQPAKNESFEALRTEEINSSVGSSTQDTSKGTAGGDALPQFRINNRVVTPDEIMAQ